MVLGDGSRLRRPVMMKRISSGCDRKAVVVIWLSSHLRLLHRFVRLPYPLHRRDKERLEETLTTVTANNGQLSIPLWWIPYDHPYQLYVYPANPASRTPSFSISTHSQHCQHSRPDPSTMKILTLLVRLRIAFPKLHRIPRLVVVVSCSETEELEFMRRES